MIMNSQRKSVGGSTLNNAFECPSVGVSSSFKKMKRNVHLFTLYLDRTALMTFADAHNGNTYRLLKTGNGNEGQGIKENNIHLNKSP